MRTKSYRWAGAAVTALALFAATAAGQQPAPFDPLDAAKAQKSIAQEKAERSAEANVRLALDNADQFAKGGANFKPKAIQTLKNAKADVQVALGLSDAARTRLTAVIDAKLAVLEGRVPAKNEPTAPGFKLDPKGAEVKTAKEALVAKYLEELNDVRAGIERIRDHELKGQTAQANAEIARLTRTYPNNPAVLPLTNNDTVKSRVIESIALNNEANRRWVANQIGISKSALPAVRDVEFPSNWKQLSEERLKSSRPQLTAKEKKLIEALDKPVTITFQERPFEEALQDISNLIDQPLLLEKKSLDDLGLNLKAGSTLQAKGLSARTVLRSILATQGLTFVVKDEAIQIVTVERAKTMLTTRVYYLGDLVQGVGPFGGIQWGPFANFQQAQANAAGIVDMIKKIDPLSWSGEGGGPGTITYHAPTQSIIVRNSTEVHYLLGSAFSPSPVK
jgi:hypothetical protein